MGNREEKVIFDRIDSSREGASQSETELKLFSDEFHQLQGSGGK
jgi:hypothetical protein